MLFGDAAELLIEEMLLQGQTDLNSAVVKVTNKLNESLAASGSGTLLFYYNNIIIIIHVYIFLQA